ncbi:response regulator receiver protein [Halothece sp. PCC 7418]|uniref:response regulator n=1 Tax=Halothece sp. (strain PCC 7418) TaxID=65093 RepID=UPI0002A073D9|nr:response regulator [Halothece sp. PCC 7418]AFZ43722.1 response regulator receiver protein [Halothece sp. PCC 7418]
MAYQILVIEDEDVIRETIVELLAADQFAPIATDNGEEGIDIAIREQPHLIICDIVMADLSGYQVLEQLRKQAETRFIPFIFLTAKASHQAYREGMELGADDYLVKPFTQDELLRAVKTQLRKKSLLQTQVHSYHEEIKKLKKTNHQLQQRKQIQEEMLKTLVEDLRGNFSKLTLAIYLLKTETAEDKRNQYLEVLEEELKWKSQLLDKASNLHHVINSENMNFLQRYKFFEAIDQDQEDGSNGIINPKP